MRFDDIIVRRFDDILYHCTAELKKPTRLPMELLKTNEDFFIELFDLYNTLEQEKVLITTHKRNTGFSTGLLFLIFYYSLKYKDITFVTKNGIVPTSLKIIYEKMCEWCKIDVEINTMSNKVLLKNGTKKFCEINFLGDTVFDIASLKGVVIIDHSVSQVNVEKFKDIVNNRAKYERVLMNFSNTQEINKLAKESNLKIKEVKLLNE